jgi:hypothetical protein
MRPPKPTTAEWRLKRENDGLRTTVVRLRHDLTNKRAMSTASKCCCPSA